MVSEWVLVPDRVDQNRGVDGDHTKPRLRMASSSLRNWSTSGTSIGSASKILCKAARRSWTSPGNRSSIASRTSRPTETPRRRPFFAAPKSHAPAAANLGRGAAWVA